MNTWPCISNCNWSCLSHTIVRSNLGLFVLFWWERSVCNLWKDIQDIKLPFVFKQNGINLLLPQILGRLMQQLRNIAKMEKFGKVRGAKGLQMVQFEGPMHRNPFVLSSFEVGWIPLSCYWPSGVLRIVLPCTATCHWSIDALICGWLNIRWNW